MSANLQHEGPPMESSSIYFEPRKSSQLLEKKVITSSYNDPLLV